MFLKRIEISGFKSFAKKTILEFSSNGKEFPITAIVGPNGSGKSNVADAIRWAIGEQSAKNLRGKKGEDVIFAGTDKKARLGSASVSLFFDNHDKRIPIEYEEVSVTRRLFRSGESEYLLNGARVRLLDVVDILAQASIGRDSYSVITQGMSDAVLAASAVERRAFFEEAAGVKQYQIEKERAIRKCESTKDNLVRVDSLLVEIEPHLKNLRRQAEKASRGKEVAQLLREKQILRFSFLWHRFQSDRATFLADRKLAERQLTEVEKLSAQLNQSLTEESKRVESREQQDELEQTGRRLREELYAIEREYSVVLGKIEIEEERRKPREVTESVSVDLPLVRLRLEEIRTHQEKLIDRISHVETIGEMQELRELARVVQTRLSELYRDAEVGSIITKRIISLPKDELEKSDRRLQSLHDDQIAFESRRTILREKLAETERQIILERERIEASRKRFFELERSARDTQYKLTALKDRVNESKVRLARVEVREEDLVGEIHEELKMKPENLPENATKNIDTDAIERDILRLKVELEHIGGIDPLVIEECSETEKRYMFLSKESEDLKTALLSLQEVIREMEGKISEVFESAWKEISGEFERYFKIIFGGGTAKLQKIKVNRRQTRLTKNGNEDVAFDEDDINAEILSGDKVVNKNTEIGIEISVSPPGKKIANLAMLSGGERSLTSLALLFAVISHNPPPFAVLDEVEAALDEANSKRFSALLTECSDRTQFIAITHNRETMRQASILYGVTMGDDGISKVLSVRLDQVDSRGKIAHDAIS